LEAALEQFSKIAARLGKRRARTDDLIDETLWSADPVPASRCRQWPCHRLPDRAGEWYAGLAKPPFNPPNWVFAPVWTVLYVLIAVAGWRTFERDRSSWPMKLWWAQLVLNFLWSPVFFAAHRIGLALLVILLLLAAILAFLVTSGGRVAWRRGCSHPTPPGWSSLRC